MDLDSCLIKYKYLFFLFFLNLFSTYVYSNPIAQPSISIIIDDLGYKLKEDVRALSLPGPVAYAILPHAPHTQKMVSIASQNGKEILLHQPMQALENNDLLGPGALTLNMTQREFTQTLEININAVQNIIGINKKNELARKVITIIK